jgi:lysophospholipase L1-like esterase
MMKINAIVAMAMLSTASFVFASGWASAQATSQVVCHGASISSGQNASKGQYTATGTTYEATLAAKLGDGWKVTNVGHPGWTIDQLDKAASGEVDSLYDPKLSENVLIILAGTNNLNGYHQSAETTFAKMEAYCKARKAAHPWKILVVTLPMSGKMDEGFKPDLDAAFVRYAALVRRNWRQFADGVVDIQADPRFGAPGAEFDSRYFHPRDHTHLTDAGYEIVGRTAAKAVTKLVSRPLAPSKNSQVKDSKR